jgi:drug/metabolite transporter (DMT)-like permease
VKAWKAELLLFFVTFIWGGTFIFTKIGLQDTTPELYVTIRFTIALILALIIFGNKFKKIKKEIIIQGLTLGLIFGGGFVLQTEGLKLTSVTKSAFITGMSVVFTPFVFKLIRKSNVQYWSKIGIIIAFFGLWLFTNPKIDSINFGDFITLISTLFWAFYIVLMDVFTKDKDSVNETVQLVILQLIGTITVALISHLILYKTNFYLNLSNNLFVSLAYNGILASFILTFIHTSFQRYTTPVKAALIFSLEPVVASVAAVLALNEILNGREYIGAIILFIGVMTSETGEFISNKLKCLFRK